MPTGQKKRAIITRMTEPSTYAGLGLLLHGIVGLIASKGTDIQAWGTVGAGLGAVFLPENNGNT
jgi:hypothetical protein